ncbi:hypothetical protein HanIR_Chr13g0634491 [Helianthus annuus]|nr:hypothetical protein HanIR_Chr13g0634491 [Helianthus annuus]
MENRFICVFPSLLPESLPARDPVAVIEDGIPPLSSDEEALWKLMYENSTRAFNFPEGILAIGDLSPFYPSCPKAFLKGKGKSSIGSCFPDEFCYLGGDEDLETRLSRKRKFDLDVGTSGVVPEVRDIHSKLRSASNKKSQSTSQTMSEALPVGTKAPVAVPASSAPLLVKKSQEGNVKPVEAVAHISLPQTSVKSKVHAPSSRVWSLLAPLFEEGYPPPYAPNWKITSSSIISTGEIAREFMSHALPPSQRFMNVVLDPQIFEDQYCMAVCESFSWGAGMLRHVQVLKEDKKDLEDRLKSSLTIAVELQCWVVIVERLLLEKEVCLLYLSCTPLGFPCILPYNSFLSACWGDDEGERESLGGASQLMQEREQLVADVKHYKSDASVSYQDVETLYADLGIVQDDNQKLATERHWLLSQGFGCFLSTFTQSPDFKSSLERIY